ncbi:TIGR03936 family radical SAM-associated protein [Ornithinimicrobium faecis]|uniref:TIGR03936 family radical SAM-associated protein n=1 Tax=Ornithinimicrobium faecis TaxID=2934158 RepID=A0ABY4YPB6_9MICO|nr:MULTISPECIES: TIGR03936 family radical SAM-associated protein [unclassified Ornithinimicrobium]USQ78539.1 TIGR03936 family radical SAM-associated protein [Ornithinimicrobium sp. HY1793]
MAAARRVPEGPTPDPAVQKLRVRYAKRGRMRFTSSRDFQRALERALRLAQIPMAYSAGFHPHPKISYANAAPTGVASEAEYVELSVTREVDPVGVRSALTASLPEGLDIVEVQVAQAGALADRLAASRWQMVFPGLEVAALRQALETFLARDSVEVTRVMKQGPRAIDVRGPVVAAEVTDAPGAAVLLLTVRHTTPTVRPAELWSALGEVSGQGLPRPTSTRLAQGPLGEADAVLDPLA